MSLHISQLYREIERSTSYHALLCILTHAYYRQNPYERIQMILLGIYIPAEA